ncbi:MAG: hypothetical protein ACRDKI_00280 [Solirubrobacterales bacterium]
MQPEVTPKVAPLSAIVKVEPESETVTSFASPLAAVKTRVFPDVPAELANDVDAAISPTRANRTEALAKEASRAILVTDARRAQR